MLNCGLLCYNGGIFEKLRSLIEEKEKVKSLRQSEKFQKVRQNGLLSVVAKKNSLYKGQKKVGQVTASLEQLFLSEDAFFDENLERNNEAAEIALNNKGALFMRTPFNRIYLSTNSNNSCDLQVPRVNCQPNKKKRHEKQTSERSFFNRKHTTRNIFCGKTF